MSGMDAIQSSGLKNSWQKGIVINNNDPQKLQRLRIRIPNLHREYGDETIPWAIPMSGAGPQGNTNTIGGISPLAIGSKVWVFFPDEDGYDTYYLNGSSDQTTKITELLEDYPDSYGHIDRAGNLLFVNTKKNTYDLHLFNGTRFFVKEDGETEITIASKCKVHIFGDLDVKADGKINLDGTQINLNGGNNAASSLEKKVRERPITSSVANRTEM